MNKAFTRREALKTAAGVASSVLLTDGVAFPQPASIQITGQPVQVELIPFSARTVRVIVRSISANNDSLNADGALVDHPLPSTRTIIRNLEMDRAVACGDLSIKVTRDPLTLQIETKQGRPVQTLKIDASTGEVSFDLGAGPLLGMGQGGQQFDRRGSLDKMGSGQGAYHLSTHGARVPIQFLIGTSGWAMFIHQPLGSFDLSQDQGRFMAADSANSLPLDLFVTGSDDPKSVLAEYARMTGYAEPVPLWSLGYQQSHRTLGSPQEILEEAKTFREKKLPCDAMIYLGTGFCPNGWNTDNGEFDWNPKAFPNPAKAIEDLHSEHFKVVLHLVLEGHRLSGTVRDACTAPPLPSGRTPDHHWPPDRQVSCYWPVHKPLLDLGVDGWWPDQGDGLDAPSRLARNRMYYEGTRMNRPGQRVYALHRNAYAGMQRYAAFLWSGDVQSRWETLKTHVPVGINSGLSGIPYWGTDIGGFIPTDEYTGELFVRWFQFAAFTPLFRSHGRDWRLHLPWGWTIGQIGYPETLSYHPDSSVLHNPAVEPICKKYLELRYRLLPYIYSVMKETCESGLPMMRALWIHYPDDKIATTRGDEYLFGRDILVAPVVEKGATSRNLYLPRGTWFDFWTKEKVEGGREITRNVDLETIPLYIRAGAVLPMGPLKQYSEEPVDGPLTFLIHPGDDGEFSLYEDDGKTDNFKNGEFMRLEASWRDRERRLSLHLARGSKMLDPRKWKIRVQIAGERTTKDVQFSGHPLTVTV